MICPNCGHKEDYDFYICPKCQYDIDVDINKDDPDFDNELASVISNQQTAYQIDANELMFEEDTGIRDESTNVIEELVDDLIEENRNIFKKLGCKVKETKMKVEELQKENKWLLFIITTFSKLLNDGKVGARKEIEPLLVVWGKKYSVVANEDWEWEVRKTESVKKPVYDIIEIDLRNVLKG